MEIWKDINEYEGLYQVSNLGRVKSLERYVNSPLRNQKTVLKREKILKQIKDNNGYMTVMLFKDGKGKKVLVHRLVANAFISNSTNKPCVNHLNGQKNDNRAENLEWCSYSENTKHSYQIGLQKITEKQRENCRKLGKRLKFKPVLQYDLQGNFIKEWDSIKKAGEEFHTSHISICCRGKAKTAGGYIWRYKEEEL